MGLDNLIQHSIRVTQCLTACQLEASPPAFSSRLTVNRPSSTHSRDCKIIHSNCPTQNANGGLYSGGKGRLLPDCPVLPPHLVVNTIHIPPMITNLKHTIVCFKSDYYTSLCYNPGAH